MLKSLSHYFFNRNRWRINPNVPDEALNRSVMIAAPHTSGWDFFYTMATFDQLGVPMRFAAKNELNRPILGPMLEKMGVVWIDRSKTSGEREGKSYVDLMAEVFDHHEKMVMLIAAEGSRSRRTKWKSGFYHIAKKAGVPITLGYLDYEKKEAGIGPAIYPSEDQAADMRKIMEFYRPIQGRHPKLFALDERYS
ncbi:MAG: 1-acyl-sn-glycerol-3-phosphate acyltransferase [Bacteroidota bacterium]